MATWDQIIDQAFVDLQTIQVGQLITALMRADAQMRLNQLLASLSTERLSVYTQVVQSYNLSPGVGSYALGQGSIWSAPSRVPKVTAWNATYGNMRKGGQPLSMEEFDVASQAKAVELQELNTAALREGIIATYPSGITAPIPSILGVDTNFPTINIRVYPVPSFSPGIVELAYWLAIPQIVSFTATVVLPEGYEAMLHFNLAVALAPQYARQGGITPELAANAQNSKASIVQQNTMMSAGPTAPAAAA